MPGKRRSEQEIRTIIGAKDESVTVAELCQRHGISEQTYYRWKAKGYGAHAGSVETDSGRANSSPLDGRRILQLEEENRRLKMLVGELMLEQSFRKAG